MNIRTINIDDIGLSRRASNALHRDGVDTVGEMLEYTEETLSGIRNMGRKSIDEVLQKITEYRKYELEEELIETKTGNESETQIDFITWCGTEEGRDFIVSRLMEKEIGISVLELLSPKTYNLLLLNNTRQLSQIIFRSESELMEIPKMDFASASEITRICRIYLKDHEEEFLEDLKRQKEVKAIKEASMRDLLYSSDLHERILQFIQQNDCELENTNLSVRAKNSLIRNGCNKVSEFIFVTKRDMEGFKGMGAGSLGEIQGYIDTYLEKHGKRIKAFCCGDDSMIWDEDKVRAIILETYNKIAFEGLSLNEFRERTVIPKQITDEMLKSVIGRLIAEGMLEYVDFRCYRIYPKFADYLSGYSGIDDRKRDIVQRRLQGETLESIATIYGMTRERVRQIVNKTIKNIRSTFRTDTGMEWFDEDYYRYFCDTYAFDKKDAGSWLGISRDTLSYLELTGGVQGTKDLQEAQDDYHHLDYGFRLKIKNYLNRNRLFLDGRWIEKKRANLEEYVVRKYCRENVSFDEFVCIYNDFLKQEEVPFDEDIYYTDSVKRARENKLSTDRFLLWKQNRQIRYYDIDGQDFTELLDTLNLDAYENIEYSTLKFMTDYPETMEKYDIRDQYELHNLLRKIVQEGSYHDFHCERTPMIRFGSFDRDGALLDLLIDNSPISQVDFAELIHQEYGYDTATIIGSYLQPLSAYYHHGVYSIDQKAMLASNRNFLLEKLQEDFYYIDEIRKMYVSLIPGADPEEINPYNLKTMGFSVLCRYVYRNHSSLEAYFKDLLTKKDITDITPYRSRFAYVVSFSGTLVNMKNNLEVLEFEPNQIITFRKLAAAGISKDDLLDFCDEVCDYVEDGTYFSVQSIKKAGFESELFELGFSDWFYANLLTSDVRLSYSKAFSNIILYKGNKQITVGTFEEALIREHGSIDVYDLMTEMEELYGCSIPDRLDLIYKVDGTDIYYDKYRDWLYASRGVFDRELDAVEGI